jgi:hypothetical protein
VCLNKVGQWLVRVPMCFKKDHVCCENHVSLETVSARKNRIVQKKLPFVRLCRFACKDAWSEFSARPDWSSSEDRKVMVSGVVVGTALYSEEFGYFHSTGRS